MSRELISVIVPVYKVEAYLDRCISQFWHKRIKILSLYWLMTAHPTAAVKYAMSGAEETGV